MSLFIKDMEMPVGCWWRDNLGLYRECPFFDRDHYCYKLNREVSDNCAKRPFDCPFIEVPTPHGRLGDLDRLYKHIKAECNIYGKPTIGFEDGNKVLKIIADTRTVIEAEEGKNE